MTALNASGYGVIYLTPNQIFDFSAGESITFDMSTERMSSRDWVDWWITPYDDNLALPLPGGLPDLNGIPRNSVHIDTQGGSPELKVTVNGSTTNYGPYSYSERLISAGVTAGTNQSAVRQTFQITISPTRVKFERLASTTATAKVFIDQALTLPFTSGVFQMGHHSYTPTKDNAGVPGTWHWDNVSFSSSTPFTILKADRRYTIGGTVNFEQASPAGSYLRFSAICRVAVDGTVVERAASVGPSHPEHLSSYFVPVAAGRTSFNISFSADGWYEGPCIAKDFSIWSRGLGSNPTSTPVTPGPTTSPTASQTNTPTVGSASVSGRLMLEGRTNPAGAQVQLTPGGRTATTSADGSFVVSGLQPGTTFTVVASAPGFVDARRVVQVSVESVSLGSTVLRAGDVDDDGAVTVTDVSIVAGLYGSIAGAGNAADLTGNGVIDVTDVSLVAGNYGLTGPSTW